MKEIKASRQSVPEKIATKFNIAHTCGYCGGLLKPSTVNQYNHLVWLCEECGYAHDSARCCADLYQVPEGWLDGASVQYTEVGLKFRESKLVNERIQISSKEEFVRTTGSNTFVWTEASTASNSTTTNYFSIKEHDMADNLNVRINVRSIETLDGWVGQVVVQEKVVWQGTTTFTEPDENEVSAEYQAVADAERHLQSKFSG
jgi:hypothetical protein